MGNALLLPSGARRLLALGMLLVVAVKVSGQDQCRLTALNGTVYDADSMPLPIGLSFPTTGEVLCDSVINADRICRQSFIDDCDKVTCKESTCNQAKIDNVKNLECGPGSSSCTGVNVTTIQDGGIVDCDSRDACKDATLRAAVDAKFTLNCGRISDTFGRLFPCMEAITFGASMIKCLAPDSCPNTKFFNIPQDGDVRCTGKDTCKGARMGVDDDGVKDASESFSVLCSGNSACQSVKIDAKNDGLVICDGGGGGTEACRGDPTDPIEITARCLECKNGGCGANCLFTSSDTDMTEECPTSDGFFGACTCLGSTGKDLTNCELLDILGSRLDTIEEKVESRLDVLEEKVESRLDVLEEKVEEILEILSAMAEPSPAPKSKKSSKSSKKIGEGRGTISTLS